MQGPKKSRVRCQMDSILAYVLPRLYSGMKLNEISGNEDLLNPDDVQMMVYPNPAAHEVYVNVAKSRMIRYLELYDLSGRLITQQSGINSSFYYFNIRNIPSGNYILKIGMNEGVAARQISIQ